MRQLTDIKIDETMMCTFKGPRGTESTCNGDSGGPLVVEQNGRFVQVGLVSFGTDNCTDPVPSVFSRITYALDWINAVISSANLES